MRICKRCEIKKPCTEFAPEERAHKRRRLDGRRQRSTLCYSCNNHVKRERTYGITQERYEELVAKGCAICCTLLCSDGRVLHVDHCHSTGKVRGVLCGECNMAVGKLRDRPDLCIAAAEYLVKHQ